MEKGAMNMGRYNEQSKLQTMRYQKENILQVKFQLNKKSEEDIIAWLNTQDNKQGYLKALIRADMARQGFTPNEK